jgi:diaminopimelate epimerase
MRFAKAHTNGNDFVIINTFLSAEDPDTVMNICNRHTGIGCDQLICVQKIAERRYKLQFFNSDSSVAEFCGNGTCAAGLYIRKILADDSEVINLEISNSTEEYDDLSLHIDKNFVLLTMPRPEIVLATPEYTIVCTRNKHLITDMKFIDSYESISKKHQDCNIHFVKRIADNAIRMKSFERGSGWTMACGSGAIAAALASGARDKINIEHDGGMSNVQIHQRFASLTVAPKISFTGEIDLRKFGYATADITTPFCLDNHEKQNLSTPRSRI